MLMFEVHAYDLLAVTSHQDDFGQYSYKKGKSSSQNLKYLLCIVFHFSWIIGKSKTMVAFIQFSFWTDAT